MGEVSAPPAIPATERQAETPAHCGDGLPGASRRGITQPMMRIILRWLLLGIATFVVGPTLARVVSIVHDSHGGAGITLFLSASPVKGTLLGALAMLLAGAFGWITSRLTTTGLGLFVTGASLSWIAFSMATTESLIRSAQSGAPLARLGAEGVVVALIGFGLSALLLRGRSDISVDGRGTRHGSESRATGGRPTISGTGGARLSHRRSDDSQARVTAALAFGASLLFSALVGWIVAREDTPGQNLAAAGLAAMCGVTVARSIAPSAPLSFCMAGTLTLAAIGPIVGRLVVGSNIVADAYTGALFPLARLTPMNWLAGAFLGAPIGAAWAASMLEKKTQTDLSSPG